MIEAGRPCPSRGGRKGIFRKSGAGDTRYRQGPDRPFESLVGKAGGDMITTHSGSQFVIRIPRPTDFFTYGKRSGAPMLPKDIGLVIAYTGMNHNDDVLDAGTGSGIAAIYFGGVAKTREDVRDPPGVLHARDEEHHRGETAQCGSGCKGLP